MYYDYLIVGSGLAGITTAELLASRFNKRVLIVEKRSHIGGNSYDEIDSSGILIHKYGPHIFHTNSSEVFNYLSKFTKWRFYEHKVEAKSGEEFYEIPINRNTLNKVFNLNLTNEKETIEFVSTLKETRYPIRNSEDIIINSLGSLLFEKFFLHYTQKQWNLYPNELDPSVCGRIPFRINTDARYFVDKYQFMPLNGYTKMFDKMLRHHNIDICLNTDYKTVINSIKYKNMIYTGAVDYYFDYSYGKLPYRSIKFVNESYNLGYYQHAAVINYVDKDVPFTRITEYKYLTGQKSAMTAITKEYPDFLGDPFYPILSVDSKLVYKRYQLEIKKEKNVMFLGRLANFQYYNMDQVVALVLKSLKNISEMKS